MPHLPSPLSRRRCTECNRRLQRYGKRRWHCPDFKRTIRFSRHRRGRPPVRGVSSRDAHLFLSGRKTVRDVQEATGCSRSAAHRRVVRGIRRLADDLPAPASPGPPTGSGEALIAVADGLWLRVGGTRVTVYIILIRPVGATEAVPAVILPLPGWESLAGWQAAFQRLPTSIRKCLVSVTVDEHGRLLSVVRSLRTPPDSYPLIQYCQFHRLAEFARQLGRKSIRWNRFAARAWDEARLLFRTRRAFDHRACIRFLQSISRSAGCPEHVQRAIRAFLREIHLACTALEFGWTGIPATTGSAEATCRDPAIPSSAGRPHERGADQPATRRASRRRSGRRRPSGGRAGKLHQLRERDEQGQRRVPEDVRLRGSGDHVMGEGCGKKRW